jgi:formylglycine-generating enzyme required for sulfatase activity
MSLVLRSSIYDEISRARNITDRLFVQVFPEALYDRPIPERHRLIFYIGHLDAFDWNIVGSRAMNQDPISRELDTLFAAGIDPPPGQLPGDTAGDWPNPFEIRRYVSHVRTNLDRLLHQAPESALHLALEHRLMHAETLTYLIHNLPYSRRLTRMRGVHSDNESPAAHFVRIPAGVVTMGKSRGAGFGWDNEFDLHSRHVEAFTMLRYKVTNHQYLKFVREGGPVPHYWVERNGNWRYRGYHGEVPLPRDFPVFVSFDQAEAYARWVGKSLPTEAQFHRAAFGTPSGFERLYPWGNEYPRSEHGNFDFSYFDQVPVTANPCGDSAFGVSQLVGNGWEWTSSVFAPFPGFQSEPLYPGYSADFFDGQHRVVKGASCATDRVFLRRSFRNWFRDHYRYAYTTFRLVEN